MLCNGIDDAACFVELSVEHLLAGKEDLRVNTVRMHVDGCLDGLICLVVLLAGHVVFGNVRQLVCLKIRHMPFRNGFLVAVEQPLKVPRLIVVAVVFHCGVFCCASVRVK